VDQIDWNAGIPSVPDGARILAILHNHPDDTMIDDRYPSPRSEGGTDWEAYEAVRSWGGTRGITVDQNLLMYIYTNEDRKTWVYDVTDKQTERTSCSL
jgi:hypothetical protein